MTSLEISEYTWKAHKHILRDIDNMIKKLNLSQPIFGLAQISESTKTWDVRYYILNKEYTLTLVSWYDINLRNAIIRRWAELEEQHILILERLAEFAKRIETSGDSISMLDFSKVLWVWRTTLFKKLREKKILMKNNLPYKKYEKYFEISEKTMNIWFKEKIIITPLVNGLWQIKLSKIF